MTVVPSHPSGSALREHMIEDMSMRGFTNDTSRDCIPCVKAFAAFIGRRPDTATTEDLRRLQLHQAQAGCGRLASTARSRRCASFSP